MTGFFSNDSVVLTSITKRESPFISFIYVIIDNFISSVVLEREKRLMVDVFSLNVFFLRLAIHHCRQLELISVVLFIKFNENQLITLPTYQTVHIL